MDFGVEYTSVTVLPDIDEAGTPGGTPEMLDFPYGENMAIQFQVVVYTTYGVSIYML